MGQARSQFRPDKRPERMEIRGILVWVWRGNGSTKIRGVHYPTTTQKLVTKMTHKRRQRVHNRKLIEDALSDLDFDDEGE